MSVGLLLHPEQFDEPYVAKSDEPYRAMSIRGVSSKVAFLTAICLSAGLWGWRAVTFYIVDVWTSQGILHEPAAHVPGLFWAALITMLICSALTFENPKLAMGTAIIYALVDGYALGCVSKLMEHKYHGIVALAVITTIIIFVAMLGLYWTRVIKIGASDRAIMGVALVWVTAALITDLIYASINGISFLDNGGLLGLVISLAISAVAVLLLLVDFDTIEKGVNGQYPKEWEWYCAMGLFITITWIYVRALRMLSRVMRLHRSLGLH